MNATYSSYEGLISVHGIDLDGDLHVQVEHLYHLGEFQLFFFSNLSAASGRALAAGRRLLVVKLLAGTGSRRWQCD